MATLIITRTNEFINLLRNYKVFIDDQEVGKIANGETREFHVRPGLHTFHSEIDWCSSSKIVLEVAENETKILKVGSFKYGNLIMPCGIAFLMLNFVLRITIGFGYLFYLTIPVLLLLLYYMSIGRKKYLTLQELPKSPQTRIQFN